MYLQSAILASILTNGRLTDILVFSVMRRFFLKFNLNKVINVFFQI